MFALVKVFRSTEEEEIFVADTEAVPEPLKLADPDELVTEETELPPRLLRLLFDALVSNEPDPIFKFKSAPTSFLLLEADVLFKTAVDPDDLPPVLATPSPFSFAKAVFEVFSVEVTNPPSDDPLLVPPLVPVMALPLYKSVVLAVSALVVVAPEFGPTATVLAPFEFDNTVPLPSNIPAVFKFDSARVFTPLEVKVATELCVFAASLWEPSEFMLTLPEDEAFADPFIADSIIESMSRAEVICFLKLREKIE